MKNYKLFNVVLFFTMIFFISCSGEDPKSDTKPPSQPANTDILDPKFEEILRAKGFDGTGSINDGKVLTSKINTLTSLNVSNKEITNLTGIEGFTALKTLDCSNNQLTSLDVSKNVALTELKVNNNPKLAKLDVRNGKNNILNASKSNFKENPKLTCIFVNDVATIKTKWKDLKDATAKYVANDKECTDAETIATATTAIPDLKFEEALRAKGLDGTGSINDGKVLTSKINTVTSLNVSNKEITNLTGIEGFTALKTLDCSNNQLTSLDVSKNVALTELKVNNNSELTKLNVRNGKNSVLNTSKSNFKNNLKLTCIFVNDVAAIKTKWKDLKDATAKYVANDKECTDTEIVATATIDIPDPKFEEALRAKGYDGTGGTANDGKVLTSKINTLTSLDVSNKGITNLKGIEGFTALKTLLCYRNQLTRLDVSNNKALTLLNCSNNKLMSLNVSENTILTELDCNLNKLISLYVGKNTKLTELKCSFNQLTSLNVSKNTALKTLSCDSNKLTSLGVKENTALTKLDCSLNKLTNLDVKENTALIDLYCSDNQLTSLNVSKNTALKTLSCTTNKLTSLDVSKNTKLIGLSCNTNQLTSLDVKENTALIDLYCDNNKLTSLNVSKNMGLKLLFCYINKLTNLDVSKNKALTLLNCSKNNLISLDVRNGNNRKLKHTIFLNNPKLTCILVDDKAYSDANWNGDKDVKAIYVEKEADCK